MNNPHAVAKIIHVAVGVIKNISGEVLIAKRAEHQHQGGLWEFPGGKVEAGETVAQALQRELQEEVGLDCKLDEMSPLIQIPFHYSDKSVYLDVYEVVESQLDGYSNATGKEGQSIAWVNQSQLSEYDFPAANIAILNALVLPGFIAITPDVPTAEILSFIKQCITRKSNQPKIIQLRAPSLDKKAYIELGKEAYTLCSVNEQNNVEAGAGSGAKRVKLVWNCPLDWFEEQYGDGLHLSESNQSNITSRPVGREQLFSLPVHSLEQLESAHELSPDFVLLSPVCSTPSHPGAEPLGFVLAKEIIASAQVPVYGLGGLSFESYKDMREIGGQGVAAISAFSN